MKRCTCGPQAGCTTPCDRKYVDREAVAELLFAGNQLARAMQDSMQRRDDLTVAWYQAVENVIPDRLKPIVCTSSEDASHEM